MNIFADFLKIEDPVLIFAVVMLIMLVAPLLVSRFKVPGMIGLILAGLVVGPNMLGMLARDGTFELLGTVGLLYLMFLAGLEINLNEFIRRRKQSLVFGALTFLVPQILGAVGAYFLFGFSWKSAILLASMFASHTLLSFPVISKLGISKNRAVTTTIGGTILTDIAALLVLAVIAESVVYEISMLFWIRQGVLLALLVFVALWVLPRIGFHFFRLVTPDGATEFVFVMAAVFLMSFGAHLAHVEPIIGAFLAGIALSRLVPENSPLMSRLQFVGQTLFIPFFLISVGMLVDLRVFFAGVDAWMVALYMSAAVILTKWLAAISSARLLGFTRDEGMLVFGISVNQAAATLAAVLVGYRLDIFDSSVLNGTILMILITCMLGPWLTEKYGRKVVESSAPSAEPVSETGGRILVPISHAKMAGHLIDVALMLRDRKADEPVHPLHVVQDGVNLDERMAVGERLLGIATAYAIAAEAPVAPVTRVDVNVAGGILHVLTEMRISTLIMGWNGRVHSRFFAFHTVVDRILHHTSQTVLVCRIRHPLNTTKRVLLAIPPLAEKQVGFGAILETARRLTIQAGAELNVLCVESFAETVKARAGKIKSGTPVKVKTIRDWKSLMPALKLSAKEDDLILLLSARRARTAWQPSLVRLPGDISLTFPECNFITIYPSDNTADNEGESDELEDKMKLPPCLAPERVLPELNGVATAEAIKRLLATMFADNPLTLDRLSSMLNQNSPVELAQGTVLLHMHVKDVSEPEVFLGINNEGFTFPDLSFPVRNLFVLLSPVDFPPDQHLGTLATLARFVQNPDNIDKIRQAVST